MVERVIATDVAVDFINYLKKIHGPIMLYQSGGCCEGSAPMCYREDDFRLGDIDVLLGTIEGVAFYMHKSQYDYWKHTQLILDVIEGRGASFSLDSVEEKHFIIQSRVFSEEEYEEVKKL